MDQPSSTETAFSFEDAGIMLPSGETILTNWNWTVRRGDAWAVAGATSSGRAIVMDCLAGHQRLASGHLRMAIAKERIQTVSFRETSGRYRFAGQYYQQRFEFAEEDNPMTVREFLHARISIPEHRVESMAATVGLAGQLDLGLMKLSNGQMRRARIARALLSEPELLLLDDPFSGLDASGRCEFSDWFRILVERGLTLILAVLPEEVPPWVTRRLELPGHDTRPMNRNDDDNVISRRESTADLADPVLELNDVSVRHGGRAIIQNVRWTVRSGERWAVLGANGAGKTTLLALVCGDHPQAFSNDVRLFGLRRGSGETIWDIKRRIGFISPEFHLHFTEPLTAFEAAATGFHDALLFRPTSDSETRRIDALFRAFGADDWKHRPFRQLPIGRQRLALLVRALVKRPPLLILDEPFQGLEYSTAAAIRDWLDDHLHPNQTLIFVTHRESEIPRTVTRVLRLAGGKAVE